MFLEAFAIYCTETFSHLVLVLVLCLGDAVALFFSQTVHIVINAHLVPGTQAVTFNNPEF